MVNNIIHVIFAIRQESYSPFSSAIILSFLRNLIILGHIRSPTPVLWTTSKDFTRINLTILSHVIHAFSLINISCRKITHAVLPCFINISLSTITIVSNIALIRSILITRCSYFIWITCICWSRCRTWRLWIRSPIYPPTILWIRCTWRGICLNNLCVTYKSKT